jgi:hypothetical protein
MDASTIPLAISASGKQWRHEFVLMNHLGHVDGASHSAAQRQIQAHPTAGCQNH